MKNLPLTPIAMASLMMLAATSGAQAQQASNAAPAELQRVVVTGSNIKRTATESSQTMAVVTRQDIEASGAQTVTQILGNLTNNDQSSLSELTGGNAWESGSSSISLRNLGLNGTLILVNGRRLASYGFANPTQNFVNIDAIAANIIERVEILKEGASAIYGSDAIGGVINIITRKDYEGLSLSTSATQSLQHSFMNDTKLGSITVGKGHLDRDGFNAYGHLEFFKRAAYKDSQVRPYLPEWFMEQNPTRGQLSGGSFPGNYTGRYPADYPDKALAGTRINKAAPGCPPDMLRDGACMYDYWKDSDAMPESQRFTMQAGARLKLNNDWTAFTEFQGAQITPKYYTNAPRSNPGSVSSWVDVPNKTVKYFTDPLLPVGHPNNPYSFPIGLNYRFTDNLDMFKNVGASTQYRLLAGAEGTAWGWDIDTAVGTMRSHATQRQRLYRDAVEYAKAITSGAYKYGQTNSQELLDKMFPEMGSTGTYEQRFADIKGSGQVGQLPGGPVMMAAGAELRHEDFRHRSTDNVWDAKIVGFTGVNIAGSRSLGAVFSELSLPVTKQLELSAALRGDKIFDGSGAVTPKLGLAFRPNASVLLRGTYAGGFRSPSLPETGVGGQNWYDTAYDPKRCDTGKAMEAVLKTGDATDKLAATEAKGLGCQASVIVNVTPNAKLKPEHSKSLSLGVVLQASNEVSMALDYYLIRRKDEINFGGIDEYIADEDANPALVRRRATPTDREIELSRRVKELSGKDIKFGANAIESVGVAYVNTKAETEVSGVDLDVRGRFKLGDWGTLNANLDLNYQLTYRSGSTDSEGTKPENAVGYRTVPRVRAVGKLSWTRGDWTLGSQTYFTSARKLADGSWDSQNTLEGCADRDIAASDCRVASRTTTNLSVSYSGIKHMTLSANVFNVFNKASTVELRPISRGQSLPLDGRVGQVTLTYNY